MAKCPEITANQALIKGKCPHCRCGNMFKHKWYNVFMFRHMHDDCPVCGLHFEVEPGFWWGAMYFSYALNTVMMLIVGLYLIFGLEDMDIWKVIGYTMATLVLVAPFTFRVSRVLMMYLFSRVRYDRNAVPEDMR